MKKSTTKKTKNKVYHIVYYVENCTPAMRKFKSIKDMETFFEEFKDRYYKTGFDGGQQDLSSYLDFYITDISGEVKFL